MTNKNINEISIPFNLIYVFLINMYIIKMYTIVNAFCVLSDKSAKLTKIDVV